MCVCSVSTSLLDYALLPNTHKLIHSQGIWTSRQMFCNGNHFYLDFFPLGVGRNVCYSDLSSEMGTCMKVLLKKSNFDTQLCGGGRPTSLLSLSFNSFKLSEYIPWGIGSVGSVSQQPGPGLPLITAARRHLEALHQGHVDLSSGCALLDAGFAPGRLRFRPLWSVARSGQCLPASSNSPAAWTASGC